MSTLANHANGFYIKFVIIRLKQSLEELFLCPISTRVESRTGTYLSQYLHATMVEFLAGILCVPFIAISLIVCPEAMRPARTTYHFTITRAHLS